MVHITVTLAKGIGNGFPMGAVITTPKIAQTLQQALYFNTFGGNPLACAVGSTVLDVSPRPSSLFPLLSVQPLLLVVLSSPLLQSSLIFSHLLISVVELLI